MRLPLILLALTTAGSLRVCGSEEGASTKETKDKPAAEAKASGEAKGKAEGTAQAETPAAAVEAQIGGQVLAVGDHQVELKLYRSGFAEALVFDAGGQLLAKPEDAKLLVHAKAEGDAKKDIALAYNAPTGRFVGHADADADADLAAGPVDVELQLAGGKNASAKLDSSVLLVGPELGGTVAVAGDHGIEVVADADGNVEALVHDSAGARVEGDADAKIDVELSGVDGKLHAVALTWNKAKARFVGKVGADVKLAAGPAKFGIEGKAHAKLPKLALRAKAKHNGKVLIAGDYSVELVGKGDMIMAYVFDANGEAYAKGDLDLSIKLGSGAFVKLVWDAPSLSYKAKVEGKFNLNVEPVTLSLKANGKAHVGAKFHAKAKAGVKAKLEGPNLNAKLNLDPKAAAKAKAEAKASLKAPSVKVTAPKIEVNKSASAGAGAKAGAKGGISFGTK